MSPTEPSDGAEEFQPSLLYVIKQVQVAIRARIDEIVRPDGLTALQYTALTVLWVLPELSTAELARRSLVTAQTMSDMVATLVERGMVERRRDDRDRRRLVLALTGDGRDLLLRLRPRVIALEQRMLKDLSTAQVFRLRQSLNSCQASLLD